MADEVTKGKRGYFERDREALHQVVDRWLEKLYDEKPNPELGEEMKLEITGYMGEVEGDEHAVLLIDRSQSGQAGLGHSYGGKPEDEGLWEGS